MLPTQKTDIPRDRPIPMPLSWMGVLYLPISPQIAKISSLILSLYRWPHFLFTAKVEIPIAISTTCICAHILCLQAFYRELSVPVANAILFTYALDSSCLLDSPAIPSSSCIIHLSLSLIFLINQHIGCFLLKMAGILFLGALHLIFPLEAMLFPKIATHLSPSPSHGPYPNNISRGHLL